MTGSSRRAALAVLCTGMLMIILDGTIVTVALPSIQDALGFSASGLAWVVNGYLVAFGGLLLLAAGQKVVDQAHSDVLSALPDADREVFVRCMTALVGDRLAKPVASDRSVRRRR